MNNLLLYCRPGFEKEAAAEITERAGNMQCYGFARVKDDSGYVIFELYDEEQADLLARKLGSASLSSSARCWWSPMS